MKKALFLTGDYWHHADTIRPLADVLLDPAVWQVVFTEDPATLLNTDQHFDLIISFKDPIENDQIPTPIWCDAEWTEDLMASVRENGTGLLLVHAAVTDLPEDHPIVQEMIQSIFINHPDQCPISVKMVKDHCITKGVKDFTFPENDEHYVMSMIENAQVEILVQTISEHGVQPGLWVRQLGKGRVCCVTPGHTTKNLLCREYIHLIKNAVAWCTE